MKHIDFNIICMFSRNELSEQESLAVSQHLASCESCNEQLILWQSFRTKAHTISSDPHDFVNSIMMKLPPIEATFSIYDYFTTWKWQATAIFASAVIFMIAYNFQTPGLDEQFAQMFKTEEVISYEL